MESVKKHLKSPGKPSLSRSLEDTRETESSPLLWVCKEQLPTRMTQRVPSVFNSDVFTSFQLTAGLCYRHLNGIACVYTKQVLPVYYKQNNLRLT